MSQQPAAQHQGGQSSWDEARVEDATQRLNILHAKVRALRETIPKMLEPLVQKHASPELLYQAVMKSINDSQSDIAEFTELMREEESKAIFEEVLRSQQQDPTDIKPWRHKDHPGWYDDNGKPQGDGQ